MKWIVGEDFCYWLNCRLGGVWVVEELFSVVRLKVVYFGWFYGLMGVGIWGFGKVSWLFY